MPAKINALTLVGLALALAACVSVSHTLLSSAHLNQRLWGSQVRVYFPGDAIPPYERVALLSVEGYERESEQEMLDSLKARAGQLGANAIILSDLSSPSEGERIAGTVTGVPAHQRGHAIAIYVKPGTP